MKRNFGNLERFLVKAKLATYAGQGDLASIKPALIGSKQLEFSDNGMSYSDIYFGMNYFSGLEVVYEHGSPLWSMSYSGGVKTNASNEDVKRIYSFLRKALKTISTDAPFRGSPFLIENDMSYVNNYCGDVQRFNGNESIKIDNREVYSLTYSGGILL
jgi:Domain of unknown function (DUF5680)